MEGVLSINRPSSHGRHTRVEPCSTELVPTGQTCQELENRKLWFLVESMGIDGIGIMQGIDSLTP